MDGLVEEIRREEDRGRRVVGVLEGAVDPDPVARVRREGEDHSAAESCLTIGKGLGDFRRAWDHSLSDRHSETTDAPLRELVAEDDGGMLGRQLGALVSRRARVSGGMFEQEDRLLDDLRLARTWCIARRAVLRQVDGPLGSDPGGEQKRQGDSVEPGCGRVEIGGSDHVWLHASGLLPACGASDRGAPRRACSVCVCVCVSTSSSTCRETCVSGAASVGGRVFCCRGRSRPRNNPPRGPMRDPPIQVRGLARAA
jgi:hypothetical protein